MNSFYIVAMAWIITVILLLWFGNKYIYFLLDRSIPWMKHTTRRFFIQLVVSALYSLCCINLTYYLFKITTNSTPPDLTQVMVLNVYGLLFTIPLLSVNFGIYFMMQWKKAQVQANQLKEDSLQAQLSSLRMQLDPHFLFNNLNVLASLIDKDRDEAQNFLDKFADVYRYVLQHKKEELVPLHTELEFIKAYCHLLKKRFGEGLVIDIPGVPDTARACCIPPLSLQMLMENAVKHNTISRDQPLRIRVYLQGKQWITVENAYQPLQKGAVVRSESGLENIRKRYQHLSALQVNVSCDRHFFKVDLPLLEIDE
ncbi:sensor histidine kinase [Chitinophaga japonensis]|uniref:Histidine kinase n=1 Tax=Chitinophaga japonensis TaxID=104662 RepID=A0A562SYE5_CHIJA|nr:histidine kinase [Chitinophaga japonensis]TWI86359.1 histidine kinase [Chitinophaga japonensis]